MAGRSPTRTQILQHISAVFRAHGYEGASLAALGAACGLSKASLYHHFPGGKEEMARQVLARSGREFTRLILAPLRSAEPAASKFADMLDGTSHYYDGGSVNCLMNTLCLGSGAAIFGTDIKAAIEAWQKALAPALKELGVAAPEDQAKAIIAQIHGALILARLAGETAPFDSVLLGLRRQYR